MTRMGLLNGVALPLWAKAGDGAAAGDNKDSSEATASASEDKGGEEPASGEAEKSAAAGDEEHSDSGDKAGDDGATPPSPDPQPEPKPAPADKWKDDRIAMLTKRLAKANAAPKPAAQPVIKPSAAPTEADLDALVESRAEQKVRLDSFNYRANAARKAGDTAFGAAFGERVNTIVNEVIGGDADELAAYNQFLVTAMEVTSDDADANGSLANLLYQVGGDPGELYRLMHLPQAKMIKELIKIGGAEPAQPSAAPKPITPIGGNKGAAHTGISADDPERADTLDTKTWMARREKQVAANNARR